MGLTSMATPGQTRPPAGAVVPVVCVIPNFLDLSSGLPEGSCPSRPRRGKPSPVTDVRGPVVVPPVTLEGAQGVYLSDNNLLPLYLLRRALKRRDSLEGRESRRASGRRINEPRTLSENLVDPEKKR